MAGSFIRPGLRNKQSEHCFFTGPNIRRVLRQQNPVFLFVPALSYPSILNGKSNRFFVFICALLSCDYNFPSFYPEMHFTRQGQLFKYICYAFIPGQLTGKMQINRTPVFHIHIIPA